MRSSRDSLLSEMAALKNQLKEQNHRLIALNQEKSSLEAKKNSIPSSDAKAQEQLKADVMNLQIVLNQLREEVKEIQNDVRFFEFPGDHKNAKAKIRVLFAFFSPSLQKFLYHFFYTPPPPN